MSTFTVDPHTLKALEGRIDFLHEELSDMHRLTPTFEGMVGGSALQSEIGSFLNAWHTGVGMIAGDMLKVADRLATAAAEYGTRDSYVADACG